MSLLEWSQNYFHAAYQNSFPLRLMHAWRWEGQRAVRGSEPCLNPVRNVWRLHGGLMMKELRANNALDRGILLQWGVFSGYDKIDQCSVTGWWVNVQSKHIYILSSVWSNRVIAVVRQRLKMFLWDYKNRETTLQRIQLLDQTGQTELVGSLNQQLQPVMVNKWDCLQSNLSLSSPKHQDVIELFLIC